MREVYRKFAAGVSNAVGSPWALVILIALVLGTGVYFGFSPAWKSNTSFLATLAALVLLCFLQHSQNHSDKAAHLKLDELIKASKRARDDTASVEEGPESRIMELKRSHADQR
ncbi:MAG: low affinity iron permease family protein [Acidobacteriota bacterium]